MKQRIVLVTGGSRGIGKSIVERVAKLGATVYATATSKAGVEKINACLKTLAVEGEGLLLNLNESESIDALFQHFADKKQYPDTLINNAGKTCDNLLLRMKDQDWDDVIEANLSGHYRLIKKFLKPLIKAKFGRIVNISSVVAVMGNSGQANYVAAKAGLIGFSKALAQEVASRNITVNCVAPGFIASDMTAQLSDAQKENIESSIPMRKVGSVNDVSATVAFLIGSDSGYITGQTIHVNGGLLMP